MGYINGLIKEPQKEDSKYEDWESENILVMNWILNSMEPLISKSFRYRTTAYDLWTATEMAYSWKKDHARIYSLTRELAQFKQGDRSLGDYYATL